MAVSDNGRVYQPWELDQWGEPLTGWKRARAFMDHVPNYVDPRTVTGYGPDIEDYLMEEPTEI